VAAAPASGIIAAVSTSDEWVLTTHGGSGTGASAADDVAGLGGSERRGSDVLELLGRVHLFANLPDVYLRRIEAVGEIEAFRKEDLVFSEGAPGDKLYVILEGRVRIGRHVPGVGEETFAVLGPGDYFGEMALIDDFPRSADARAHEDCRLFVIAKTELGDLLFIDRDLAYDLLWNFVRTLCGRLRDSNDKMTMLAVSSRF
jgi:CRP/FNR family transcriptional regulator, cyclic AMP receptor protein